MRRRQYHVVIKFKDGKTDRFEDGRYTVEHRGAFLIVHYEDGRTRQWPAADIEKVETS